MKKPIGTCLAITLALLMQHAHARNELKTTKVTCFCKATRSGQSTILNLASSKPYEITGGPGVALVPENMSNCRKHCLKQAQDRRLEIAAAACSMGVPDDTWITIQHTLGTRRYFETAHFKLTNKPATPRMEWVCRAPWRSNTSNQIGGITQDRRCKKLHGTYTGPAFPNGTDIGGGNAFTWGNEIWVYGTAANGGAALYQQYNLQVIEAVCDLQP